MSRLRRLISLANLTARRAKRRGQIATFLLLSIVGALIVTLMTANLGHLSLQATTAANAADSAALLLASQLATKSNQLYAGLDNHTKKCVSTGILSAVLAVVLAIIGTILLPGVGTAIGASIGLSGTAALVVGGAALGAAGGAIGGTIAGTGALQGALAGLAIGAAVGFAAAAFAPASVSAPASGGAAGGAGGTAGGAGGAGGAAGGAGGATGGAGGAAGGAGGAGGAAGGAGGAAGGAGAAGTPLAPGTFTAGTEGATLSGVGNVAAGASVPVTEGTMLTAGAGVLAPSIGFWVITNAALAIAAPIYNASVQSDILKDTVDEFAKALNGAPQHLRAQQSTIFQALLLTVDDPNTSPDTPDVDGDGNRTELVPDFAIFWHHHIQELKDNMPAYSALAWNFVHGPFETFADFAKLQAGCYTLWLGGTLVPAACQVGTPGWGAGIGGPGGGAGAGNFPGFLVSSDLNYGNQTGGEDGALEELVQGIEATGYHDFSWWELGPAWNAYNTWANDENCDDCPPPPGYDVVNALDNALLSAAQDWNELNALSQKNLGATLEDWLLLYYDPNPDPDDPEATDLYHELEAFINGTPTDAGILQWEAELQALYANLPDCTFTYLPGFPYPTPTLVDNPPCRQITEDYPTDPDVGFASSDTDLADEFDPVIGSGQGLVNLRNGIQQFMGDLQAFADSVPFIFSGGKNPVVYEWDDSRGHHSMAAKTGPFKVPHLKSYKTGNWLKGKKCVKIVDGKREGTGTNNGTWVKITRTDPSNVNAGLWNWNPQGGTIEKKSKACFDVFHPHKPNKKLYLCATDF